MSGKRLPVYSGVIVFGVDPGLRTFGLTVMRATQDGARQVVDVKCLRQPTTPPKKRRREGIRRADDDQRRLGEVVRVFAGALRAYHPLIVACEAYQPFGGGRVAPKVHVQMGSVVGAVYALSVTHDAVFLDYSPSELKRAVGAESSSKADVARAVEGVFPGYPWPRAKGLIVEHAADATAAAICCLSDPAVIMRLGVR